MAYRPYWSAEWLSEVTNDTTTFVDLDNGAGALVHPAAGQVAGTRYVAFWMAAASIALTSTADYRLRLLKDGAAVVLVNNEAKESSSPPDYDVQGGLYSYVAAGPPVDVAFKLQLAVESSGEAKAKNARIGIIPLAADDKYVESLSRVTTTSSSGTTAATLSFTPSTPGDYIFVMSALIDGGTGGSTQAWLNRNSGAAESFYAGVSPKDSTNRTAAMIVWRQNGLSGAQSVSAMVRSVSGETAGMSETRIVAFRVDGFDNVYSTELATDNEGAQTTYQTALSQTFTPAATPHLTLAALRKRGTSNSVSGYSQYDDGGVVVAEDVREAAITNGSWPFSVHRIATYAASSRTQAIQRKSETGSTTTRISDGAAIVTFDLGAAPAGSTYDEDISLAASLGLSKARDLSIPVAASLAVQAAIAQAAQTDFGPALTLGTSLAASTGAVGTFEAAATIGAQAAILGLGSTVFAEAVSLASALDLSADAQREIAGAFALGVAATKTAGATLTAERALALAVEAGFSASGLITAEAAAAFAVALALETEGSLEGRTFDEALSLGLAALVATAAQAERTGTVDLGVELSADTHGQAIHNVVVALAAALGQSVTAALEISKAATLAVAADVDAAGQLTVSGSLSLGAATGLGLSAAAVLNQGISFEARFDADASGNLTADEALSLAVQAAVQAVLISGVNVVSTIELSGVRDLRVALQGVRSQRQSLTGTMQITVRLNGRLN